MPNAPKPLKINEPAREPRPQYGRLHKALAPLVLADRPICERCRVAFSEHAHHLVADARSIYDYEALCERCHLEEHH